MDDDWGYTHFRTCRKMDMGQSPMESQVDFRSKILWSLTVTYHPGWFVCEFDRKISQLWRWAPQSSPSPMVRFLGASNLQNSRLHSLASMDFHHRTPWIYKPIKYQRCPGNMNQLTMENVDESGLLSLWSAGYPVPGFLVWVLMDISGSQLIQKDIRMDGGI